MLTGVASIEADEWLQLLAHHPIFDGHGVRSGKNAHGLKVRERVALRGTDLFIATGSEVRWINLKACKDAFVRFESKRVGLRSADSSKSKSVGTNLEAVAAVPWFRLGCEALSFDIDRLVVNASGKLLVAVGLHQVA
ncbi:hypothetical protein LPJ58_001687, partial [Coemansia sp. RSA 1591]